MRHTFALLCCLISLFAHAQIRRGDHIVTLNQTYSLEGPTQLFHAADFGELGFVLGDRYSYISLAPTYGYALTDRLVVGGSPNGMVSRWFGQWNWGVSLDPYLRYYFVNRERLGVYGQVSSTLGLVQQTFSSFDRVNLRAGLQVPLTSGVWVGPAVDYTVRSGTNYLSLGGQIEVVLNSKGRDGASPVSSLRAGALMLGGQLASIGLSKFITSGSVDLGGHYFLTKRWAVGLSLGVAVGRVDLQPTTRPVEWPYRLSASLSSRYYLVPVGRLLWYAEAGAGYSIFHSDRSDQSSIGTPESRQHAYTAATGGQYFLQDNIALEFGPQLRRYSQDGDGYTNIGVTGGVRFFLR
ncbi:hypothetical protein [Neolewinella xylanilytica]|uniref:hypothetical protein n=1 Tax=Neolewinella xylanilytica TaxID=1514080 RepID=UPI000CEAD748|nr:hypothetical protein [Neolewinella xylanilytica]